MPPEDEFNALVANSGLYGSFLGFTSTEIELYYKPYLARAANTLSLPITKLLDRINSQYGGFCFEETCKQKVFNPRSVLKFLHKPSEDLKNYWQEDKGTDTALQEYLGHYQLRKLEEYLKPKFIESMQLSCFWGSEHVNDLILLIQTGYLTLKRSAYSEFEIGITNQEVATSFATVEMKF